MLGVRFNGARKRGRARHELPAPAVASFDNHLSSEDITACAAYDTTKLVFSCSCGIGKHKRVLSCDRTTRVQGRIRCKVCSKRGSTHEQECYNVLDKMPAIQAYAVEAHALKGTLQFDGRALSLGQHRWDVMVLNPARVLVEVQGEQHTAKHDMRGNHPYASLQEHSLRDQALADAAMKAGFTVVWLHPGDIVGRSKRWQRVLQKAADHARANKAPKLFSA